MQHLLLGNLINKAAQLLKIQKNKQNYCFSKNKCKLNVIKVKITYRYKLIQTTYQKNNKLNKIVITQNHY